MSLKILRAKFFRNWIKKRTSFATFVVNCPKWPQNEILHVCHLTCRNGINQVFLRRQVFKLKNKKLKGFFFLYFINRVVFKIHSSTTTYPFDTGVVEPENFFALTFSLKNTQKQNLHSQMQQETLKFTCKMNSIPIA
jgi:hypothetical protein